MGCLLSLTFCDSNFFRGVIRFGCFGHQFGRGALIKRGVVILICSVLFPAFLKNNLNFSMRDVKKLNFSSETGTLIRNGISNSDGGMMLIMIWSKARLNICHKMYQHNIKRFSFVLWSPNLSGVVPVGFQRTTEHAKSLE